MISGNINLRKVDVVSSIKTSLIITSSQDVRLAIMKMLNICTNHHHIRIINLRDLPIIFI